MVRCSFCRETIEQGTGKLFIKNDGRMFAFCGNTCQKHLFKLKHKPRNTRWTKVFVKEKKDRGEKTQ